MLEFIIVMLLMDLLCSIPSKVEYVKAETPKPNPYDNGTPDKYVLEKSWEFDNIDDCMDFRELRRSGWRGNAKDFYELKAKGEI